MPMNRATGQDDEGDDEERVAEPIDATDQAERDDRAGQRRQEHRRPAERLVPGEAPRGEQRPVLRRQDLEADLDGRRRRAGRARRATGTAPGSAGGAALRSNVIRFLRAGVGTLSIRDAGQTGARRLGGCDEALRRLGDLARGSRRGG